MTNDKPPKSTLLSITLHVCLPLATALMFYQLILAILFICLLMAIFDVLEIAFSAVLRSLPSPGTVAKGLISPRQKKEPTQIIYVGSLKERKAKLYANHMNNPNITSREFFEWQENIERIEKNRESEN